MENKKISFFSDTKIFVYCPAGIVTGGAELLHQLVDLLNSYNRNAFIVYYGSKPHRIPDDYNKYNIQLSDKVIDKEHNIIVFYEGIYDKVFSIKQAQILLWWLSVDNFFICQKDYLLLIDLFFYNKKFALNCFLKRVKFFTKHLLLLSHNNVFHYSIRSLKKKENIVFNAYQSEYAKYFLTKKGFTNLVALKDYINTDYSYNKNIIPSKEKIVLYNPKKGFDFTSLIIKSSSDIIWKPIQNMTRSEVKQLMLKSMLYIDFGYHPGKDRLPREAAISGCCIITGKKGSAGFFGDIPISDNYKYNQRRKDISLIISKIRYILSNYPECINDFEYYRNCIINEKREFESQVKNIFQGE